MSPMSSFTYLIERTWFTPAWSLSCHYLFTWMTSITITKLSSRTNLLALIGNWDLINFSRMPPLFFCVPPSYLINWIQIDFIVSALACICRMCLCALPPSIHIYPFVVICSYSNQLTAGQMKHRPFLGWTERAKLVSPSVLSLVR